MCWACDAPSLEVAHVVARQDTAINELTARGLIDFDLKSKQNTVGLCPNCHGWFDNAMDPGFCFLPADLDFFIRFELKDRAKRRAARVNDSPDPGRKVPNARQYQRYQERVGDIEVGGTGGLYDLLYLLKNQPRVTQPRAWNGHPLASIRRAFGLLGSPRTSKIPETVLDKLLILRDLYFRDDGDRVLEKHGLTLPPPDEDNEAGDEEDNEEDEFEADDEKEEDYEERPPKRVKRVQKSTHGGGEPSRNRAIKEEDNWEFGPSSTTENVVTRYAPLILSSGSI
ncbi:hypothetical protein ASPWEDRAFT_174794 [Aspergillus wentii DTO 134E9]|uniref:HNH nuclease domain-containing protein n=1 Tax=Aspergillus wentii DTO 134E9 TaxID=1073089 RepID=A0A1L9REN8_ASPWE|nr:uncharacterized protein ASPWEDRAFT_174794 [Aspergillus wentii DTO 134E9]KAI9933633.1 hypothetical protein MW887_008106 [Aspergillus wentii]OJJ33386.1 hypothetical protein ASPWEDRAFT_174794 [Aspergillus wentii DTO 134E9]